MSFLTYKNIVDVFEGGATAHTQVNTFAEGSLDYLDVVSSNATFPLMYLRPISSGGIQGRDRLLTFELYSLDIPKLSEESPLLLKSRTEMYLYDMLDYVNFHPNVPSTMEFTMSELVPVSEAFQDRVYGWMSKITIKTPAARIADPGVTTC